MFNISSYLDKFKSLGFDDLVIKDAVILVLNNKLNTTISRSDISLRDGVAYIRSNPTVKNQLLIKKTAILEILMTKTDKIKDIR